MNKLAKYKLCGDVDAPATGKLLYLILCELANRNGEVIIPQRKISDALHISKGTISRNLRRLRDNGYIDVRHITATAAAPPTNTELDRSDAIMRIQLTKQECRWLADLANKAKIEAIHANEETPHPLFELRRDNMADLENTLNTAIQKEIQKERNSAR